MIEFRRQAANRLKTNFTCWAKIGHFKLCIFPPGHKIPGGESRVSEWFWAILSSVAPGTLPKGMESERAAQFESIAGAWMADGGLGRAQYHVVRAAKDFLLSAEGVKRVSNTRKRRGQIRELKAYLDEADKPVRSGSRTHKSKGQKRHGGLTRTT